jgi:hypothetical protein
MRFAVHTPYNTLKLYLWSILGFCSLQQTIRSCELLYFTVSPKGWYCKKKKKYRHGKHLDRKYSSLA